MITSDEWRKLIVTKQNVDDWELWNAKESNDQWHALGSIGYIRETGSLRPAPGVNEEGSDEDALGIGDFLGGSAARIGLRIPASPPATKARSKAPYGAMTQESDPTSRGSEEKTKLQQSPERPVELKPGPPKEPEITKATSQESGNGKKAESDPKQWCMQAMPGKNVAPARVSSQESVAQKPEGGLWLQEGSQVLGFGCHQDYTYREARNWICGGTVNLNGILQGSNLVSEKVLNFLNWMQKLQQAMGDAKREAV